MYLVDTNVISEARKGKKANPGVQEFFRTTDHADLYLSVQTIGEIRRGWKISGIAAICFKPKNWRNGLIC